jgi:uncharacterized protein (TIGR02246 family)
MNEDTQAIQNVLDELADAWNHADGTTYGTYFTEDADYIDVTGTHTIGGQAIGRIHQFLFEGPLKGSILQRDRSNTEVQFLAPDVALVIGTGASKLAGQTEAPEDRKSINTTILVKHNGQWRIRAFQNNRILVFGSPTK